MNAQTPVQAAEKPLPEATLICVPPERTREMWSAVSSMVTDGFAAMDESVPTDIFDRLANRKCLLWVACDKKNQIVAALLTSLIPMRSGLVCRMGACGGSDLAIWQQLHTRIEDYARAEGCIKVTIEGRPGWQRVLKGYKQAAVLLEKRL